MSALQRQTYANTTQPLFMPIGGGTFSGDVSTTGSFIAEDSNGVARAELGSSASDGYVACASGQKLYFGGISGLPGQSYIQPSASTNQDLLYVGGVASVFSLRVNTSGAAAAMGSGTLVNGAATINTTACLGVNSKIFLVRTDLNTSTALGELRIRAKNVGNFLVEATTLATPPLSAQTGDQSSFDWIVINPQ